MEWVKKRWLLQNPRLRIRQPPTPIRTLLLCIWICPIFLVMRIALGKRLWISVRKKSKNSEFKTDVDGKNLLFHFAKGGDVVAKVKRVGSQFVLLAHSKLSLDYEFRGSSWTKVRKTPLFLPMERSAMISFAIPLPWQRPSSPVAKGTDSCSGKTRTKRN